MNVGVNSKFTNGFAPEPPPRVLASGGCSVVNTFIISI